MELVLMLCVGLGKFSTGEKSAQGKIPLTPIFSVKNAKVQIMNKDSGRLRKKLPNLLRNIKRLLLSILAGFTFSS
jgi:hypothetical protein